MINRTLTMYGFQGRIWGVVLIFILIASVILLAGYTGSASIINPANLKAHSNFEADQYKIRSFKGPGHQHISTFTGPGHQHISTHQISETKEFRDKTYAIIFDAGSTGSRIHVFEFKIKQPDNELELVKETFQQIKPGLSSFAEEAKQGAESLRPMLNKALQVVPSKIQRRIPIILKATAGLRLLSEEKAQNLLNEVKSMFLEYPFKLGNNGVQIMDGNDEGIYSWMTINFLLNLFTSNSNNTVAALDLGGGSTQITFTPVFMSQLNKEEKNSIQHTTLFTKSYRVYTHSYLGLGLMSARLSLLGGLETSDTNLSSPCLPHNYNGTWKQGGKEYFIKGQETKENQFNSCSQLVKKFVKSHVQPLKELDLREVYIFSYFYDRAADAKMIDFDVGGVTKVSNFLETAKKVFEKPNLEDPFLGLDLLYIYSLLYDGYKLSADKPVHLKKKINGCETSWCLGAAFHLLSSIGLAR